MTTKKLIILVLTTLLLQTALSAEDVYRPPEFKVYELSQLVCVARQIGEYRVQVLLEPNEPKAGERFWVTAVISDLQGRPASVTAYMVVTDGLNVVNFTRPFRVANGIFRTELLLERPGSYVAAIAVSGSNGTYLINVPITVLEDLQSLLNSIVVTVSVMGAFWGAAVGLSVLFLRNRRSTAPRASQPRGTSVA